MSTDTLTRQMHESRARRLARRLGLPVRALDWWLEHPDYAAGA